MFEFKKIRAVRKIFKPCKVYNFSVPQYETYLANGFVVHNCQNYKISQTVQGNKKFFSPVEIARLAQEKSSGIAFTFNEPTVHFEYILDTSIVIDRHCPIVVKTNGFVTPDILGDLALVVDAFNIDIKGDEEEYRNVCGGRMQPVLKSIEKVYSSGSHLEISYLVTPRLLYDRPFHQRMIDLLCDKPDIPIHFLYFYPFYKMSDSAYEVSELLPLVDMFREHMKYVYISNVYKPEVLKYRNSYCPSCGLLMVDRTKGVKVVSTECCGNFIDVVAGDCD